MAEFVPYSEKQNIFDVEAWEANRFLDMDCPTAVAASNIMHRVVERLLTIDSKFSVDDFEFLVYDDDQPNAAYVAASQTKNGKNVIMISTGLTKLCKTEDEFAGVLSHELGHFAYKKLYGDAKNTVFQERGADLHAIDFMNAGGYNPEAYFNVCQRMYNMGGHHSFHLLEVHGSSFARVEDTGTRLAEKHLGEGDFRVDAPTGLWDGFVKIMQKPDKYIPYWEHVINNSFTPKQLKKTGRPKPDQLLDLILTQARAGKLNYRERAGDVVECINKYSPTKESPKVVEKFVKEFMELVVASRDNKTDGPSLYRAFYYNLSSLLDFVSEKFYNRQKFAVTGPILDLQKSLQELIDYTTPRDGSNLSKSEIDKIEEMENSLLRINLGNLDLKCCYRLFNNLPKFKMPAPELAVGTRMPTDALRGILQSHSYINDISDCRDCGYEWITDKLDNYCGKILAIDPDEIKKIRAERQDIKAKSERIKHYENNHQQLVRYIQVLQLLYDFDKGRVTAADVQDAIGAMGFDRWRWLEDVYDILAKGITLGDYQGENKYFIDDVAMVNNSQAFTELRIKPMLHSLRDAAAHVLPDNNINFDTWPDDISGIEHVHHVLEQLNIHEYPTHHDGSDMWQNHPLYPMARVVSLGDSSHSITSLFRILDKLARAGIQTYNLYAWDLVVFADKGCSFGGFNLQFDNNKLDLELIKQKTSASKTVNNNLFKLAAEYSTNYGQWLHNPLDDALEQEINTYTDLHLTEQMLKQCNIFPNSEQKLLDIMKMPDARSFRDTGVPITIKKYVLRYYIQKDLPITNLVPILRQLLENIPYVRGINKFFQEALGDYITRHNLIPNDFKSKYELYVCMEAADLFSHEQSNQAKLLDMMISQLKQMPDNEQENYAYMLLSGFYNDFDKEIFYRKSKTMEVPLVKKQLMEILTDKITKRLGIDDDSDEYFEKIKTTVQQLKAAPKYYDPNTSDKEPRNAFNKPDLGDIYRLLSDKIQSQERVSKFLADDKGAVFSDKDFQSKDLLGRGVENMLDLLNRDPAYSRYAIEFLNTKLSEKSITEFREKCFNKSHKWQTVHDTLTPDTIENLYHAFWSSGLEVRAVIMNKLLNRAFETLDEKIKYVCDMNFAADNKYRADAEMICDCVIKSFKEYEQGLILAAIASADENKQEGKNASRSVGDGLRMFFETMGPAWVKFGQLLSYVPDLPSEIRRDLGKLKDQADIPARWDLYNDLHDALPNDIANRIERVQDIVGAGSFWVTAVVQFKNDAGVPEKKVLQLLRPYAKARADSGFNTIEQAIKKLSQKQKSYKMLQSVAHQAHESSGYEVDVNFGNKQYEKAKQLYGDIRINIDGTTYTPHVADWRYYGSGKNQIAYKIMDYADGATLAKTKEPEDARRKMALAYFTIELTNLFKGDVWDIDRHQGQQNFNVISPNAVDINIYDTGAQLPQAPDKKNKVLLASMFFGLIQSVQSGKGIDAYILKTIKRLDKLQNNLKIDVSYVSNVQKGLMALSDIIEYQKEIKDADGNIIQPRKSLSSDDLANAVRAVLNNPTVDKYLRVVISGRVVAQKLSKLEIQALKELSQATEGDNPIQIDIVGNNTTSLSQGHNKSQAEIDVLENPDDYILGIHKKYIKKETDTTVMQGLKELGAAFM